MMLENNYPIIIEKTANGYQVRPITGPHDIVCISDIHVFQELGIAASTRDYQKPGETLLDWIQTHFKDKP